MNSSSLKILQISPMVPFPLDNGGRIGIYGITNYLAKRNHRIDFVTFRKDSDYDYAFGELSKICTPHILDIDAENSIPGAAANLFSRVPYNISKYNNRKLRAFLKQYFKNNSPDIVHVDNLHLGWTYDLIREYTDCPIVLREHNVELLIMKRFSEAQQNIFLKWYSNLQYKKFLKYEPETCAKFDLCLMITEEDRKFILDMNPEIKTAIIPAGVESSLLERGTVPVIPYSLYHIGSLKWLPNHDALSWFLKDIFPGVIKELPQVKFYIYGEGSSSFKIDDAVKNNVVIKGWVEDIFEEIKDKDLAVVPLRIGGGMRIKLIELMALGKNILSTSVGSEGINAVPGKHMLTADSAADFRNEIIRHFKSGSGLDGAKARQFVAENFTWEKVAEKLENLYLYLLDKK